MMGSRGDYSGIECDAFSRRSRRALCWSRGSLKKIKRQYAKRVRKTAKLSAVSEIVR